MTISKTEMRNEKSMHIDKMSTSDAVKLMIEANYDAVRAAYDAHESIAEAVDIIADSLANGHSLIYVGAGTSGRLGVLDASECPPTFGVSPDKVRGIIAGGKECMFRASENAEDSFESGENAIIEGSVKAGDTVVGISAAGNAGFVSGALSKARALGCRTVAVSSNEHGEILKIADVAVLTDTGAEIITGSTRLKAGTAQKIVLNTLSSCAMIKLGYIYENMMINLSPTNIKLRQRVISITASVLGCDKCTAEELLSENGWSIRKTVGME